MTQPKKPRKSKTTSGKAAKASGRAPEVSEGGEAGEQADATALQGLIKGVMDWYLAKLNGDPQMEGFDILMNVENPEGVTGHKYVLGSYDASMPRLRQDLETLYPNCIRYVCAWRGWWERPDGQKFDGALLLIESKLIQPLIAGIPIAPDASGQRVIAGKLQVLNTADWSLLHRSK
jgi:hypothetical protein